MKKRTVKENFESVLVRIENSLKDGLLEETNCGLEQISFCNYLEYHSVRAKNQMLKLLKSEETRNDFMIKQGYGSEWRELRSQAIVIMRTTINTMRII